MSNFLAFSDYDIIAYLMVGLAFFMVLDLVLGFGFLYRTNWNTGSVTAILLLAYLGGHLISIPSRVVFEEWAAKSCLKNPIVHLIPKIVQNDKNIPSEISSAICTVTIWWIPWSGYATPATPDVVKRITDKSRTADSDALFHEAFVTAKQDPNSYERMMIFQRLYILFRNMGFLALCGLIAVLVKRALFQFGLWRPDRHLIHYGVRPWMLSFWGQFAVFLVLSGGLFDRFLFFYRLYSLEVLSSFAYATMPIIE